MGLIDRIRAGTYVADHEPVAVPGRRTSLAETAERIRAGEAVLPAVRDFLDQVPRASAGQLAALLDEEPAPTGDARADALLGGIGEWVVVTREVPCPAWTQAPQRFLDSFWFVSDVDGFRATAIAQTPISLKRRGIFWPARSLVRV